MTKQTHKGFTLFELLLVIAILAILMVGSLVNWKSQFQKGFDAKRKGDLAKLKAVLEHYSIDNGCYPTEDLMTCDSRIFASYNMAKVLCDPEGGNPYLYQLVDTSNPCLGYRLYTILKRANDPDIERICGTDGCVTVDGVTYNYGVSSGVPVKQ